MFYENDDVMLSIWMDDEVSLNEILYPPLEDEYDEEDFEEVYEDLIMLDDEELIALRRCDVRFDEILTELEEETDDEEIRRYLHITSYRYNSGDTECDEQDLRW